MNFHTRPRSADLLLLARQGFGALKDLLFRVFQLPYQLLPGSKLQNAVLRQNVCFRQACVHYHEGASVIFEPAELKPTSPAELDS